VDFVDGDGGSVVKKYFDATRRASAKDAWFQIIGIISGATVTLTTVHHVSGSV
jgi:hypothetical protein